MNAWLLTWKWLKDEPAEPLVAILSSRKSSRSVVELMEFIVLRSKANADELAYYAHRRKPAEYKAQTPLIVNRVPHGDRILCGRDPWLYARKVRELTVTMDRATNEETISWREPEDYACVDGNDNKIFVSDEGELKTLRRSLRPLSTDGQEKWRVFPEFQRCAPE